MVYYIDGGIDMPKPTFYRLPEERQKEILQAAFEEFSTNPLQEASVGNITKKLSLSRASFYKYFNDLEEAYTYIYQKMTRDPHRLLLESLQEANGIFFDGMNRYAEKMADRFFDPKSRSFYHNLLVKMDYHLFSQLEKNTNVPTMDYNQFLQEVIEIIYWEEIAVEEQELLAFLDFIKEIFHELFMKSFLREWTEEQTLAAIQQRLDWLKRGILK